MAQRVSSAVALDHPDKSGKKGAAGARRSSDDSPLAWLRRHGHLSQRQAAAAERLETEYRRASLAPRVTMAWDATPGGHRRGPYGAPDPTETQLAARRRFHAAMAAVGPGLADVLWRVVCDGAGLEAAERALGWPRRAGKLVLCLALDRLADHYDPPRRRAAFEPYGQKELD